MLTIVNAITHDMIRATEDILAKVKKSDDCRRKSIRRFAPYKFLKRVYSAYIDLTERKLVKALRVVATRRYDVVQRSNWHPLRTVIDATSQHPDHKVRSRWTRALEVAYLKGVHPDDLISFFETNGGIAGCARLASKLIRNRKKTLDCWSDDYEEEDVDEPDFDDDGDGSDRDWPEE